MLSGSRALALGLVGLSSHLALQEAPRGTPAELLRRAEELAREDHIAEARRAYRDLAREFPETREGRLAAKRTRPSAFLGAAVLVQNGPIENRLDVIVLGDGYTEEHQRALAELAEDIPPILERVEPFREYWSCFNFWRGVCVSADDGLDGFGREADTLLGGRTLATDAGHVSIDGESVHDVLAEFPGSDGLAVVFVRQGVLGSTGGGIAVIGGRDSRITVHEWGHALGLGDEYSTHTHERGAAKESPNVSVSEDPAKVPWRHWLEARHPEVGLYEGAAGRVRDVWRPVASGCVMNDGAAFCPVCREAIVLRLFASIDPIEAAFPQPPPPGIREPIRLWRDTLELRVRTLRPATHDLEARWWVESAKLLPSTTTRPSAPAQARYPDRTQRGALPELAERPSSRGGVGPDGMAVLRLQREELEPGLYRVTCRVRDPAQPFGEKWPWVLADPRGLLESERVWWVEVR